MLQRDVYKRQAMDQGINFFDHADIYGNGESEHIFGEAIKGIPREKMIVQTKCGIRPGLCYDFSKEHILESVDKSLKRLNMDYVDILLLHRPDTLMEPEEVAEAFDILEKEGKVRYFGVSNQNSMQMELLQHYCCLLYTSVENNLYTKSTCSNRTIFTGSSMWRYAFYFRTNSGKS